MTSTADINKLGAKAIEDWLQVSASLGAYGVDVISQLKFGDVQLEGFTVDENGELKSNKASRVLLTLRATVQKDWCNPANFLHGGCAAYLLDVCTSIAMRPFSRDNFWRTTGMSAGITINYLVALPCDTTVLLVCRTLSQGKALAVYGFDITSEDGKIVYVTGTHTKADTNKVHKL